MNEEDETAMGCAILIAVFLGISLLATLVALVMVAVKSIQWVL